MTRFLRGQRRFGCVDDGEAIRVWLVSYVTLAGRADSTAYLSAQLDNRFVGTRMTRFCEPCSRSNQPHDL